MTTSSTPASAATRRASRVRRPDYAQLPASRARPDPPAGARVLPARTVETGDDRAGLPTAGDGVLVDANLTV